MTSRDFVYWLNGWFELNETIDHREGATPETLKVIKNHLAMVFKHEIDPSFGKQLPELQKTHDGSLKSYCESFIKTESKINC